MVLGLTITMVYAWKSHSLPSLFDEAHAVYSSIVIMVIVLLAGISIASFAGDPNIAPDLSYLTLVSLNKSGNYIERFEQVSEIYSFGTYVRS